LVTSQNRYYVNSWRSTSASSARNGSATPAQAKPLTPPPDTPERLLDERAELRRGYHSVAQIVALNDQIARQDLRSSGGGTDVPFGIRRFTRCAQASDARLGAVFAPRRP
jgi:hypothetical protein